MTCAIVYDSLSGNTKQVAEMLAEQLAGRKDIEFAGIAPVVPVPAAADAGDAPVAGAPSSDAACAEELAATADTVLFGFWTDKGVCSERARAFLPHLTGKRVFLFGTAGFGESDEYFDRILVNVRSLLPDGASYLGGAMCQGKMDAGIKARYEAQAAAHPDEPRWQLMLKTYEQGQGHPNAEDGARIGSALRVALAQEA